MAFEKILYKAEVPKIMADRLCEMAGRFKG